MTALPRKRKESSNNTLSTDENGKGTISSTKTLASLHRPHRMRSHELSLLLGYKLAQIMLNSLEALLDDEGDCDNSIVCASTISWALNPDETAKGHFKPVPPQPCRAMGRKRVGSRQRKMTAE